MLMWILNLGFAAGAVDAVVANSGVRWKASVARRKKIRRKR